MKSYFWRAHVSLFGVRSIQFRFQIKEPVEHFEVSHDARTRVWSSIKISHMLAVGGFGSLRTYRNHHAGSLDMIFFFISLESLLLPGIGRSFR